MKEKILAALDSPRDLETLYRSNPAAFTNAFPEVLEELPESAVLQAWRERLFFEEKEEPPSRRSGSGGLWLTVVLALIAGTMMKLPQFAGFVKDKDFFYAQNLGAILMGALIVYFCIRKCCRAKTAIGIILMLLSGVVYLNALPDEPGSQTVPLSCMHMPFFFWSLLGVAFTGGLWRSPEKRMEFVRYNGELLMYTTMILLGGIVLTGLTIGLFKLIGLKIENWYVKNIVVYGATASPIVATFLIDRVVGSRFKIAPLLAKVFTPLFLVTVVAYLIAIAVKRKSPFTERDFLIAFNGLLLVVLGLCVFSISERGRKESTGVFDVLNIGLVSVTLAIDVIALAAIVFRLASYGFSPNRIAVLGGNLLAFCHLAGILYCYARFVRRRSAFQTMERWIVGYIPAYTAWSLIVGIGLPSIFLLR